MANTIKLKRGSGSDPSASDLVVGELAIRTDSGKLFTKKENGSVAEISGSGGGGISDGDKGDITVSNSGDTFTIDDGVVTSAKIEDGTIVNGDISASAAIDVSKLSGVLPLTGGTLTGSLIISNNTNPSLTFTDSNDNPDFQIGNSDGTLRIRDTTNAANRMTITSSAVDINVNLDANAGLDVTGNITGTGDLTLTSTDAGSSASPIIELYRNSESPADADYLGQFKFTGESDDGSKEVYAKITGKIDDASSGTEDGLIEFALRKAGSNNIGARLTSTDLKLINGTGLEVAGNISCDGTVDGRDLATDGTKLDGIATGATNVSNTNQLTNGAGFLTSVGTSNIDDDAVTFAKIQNVSATNRILGRDSAGAGVIEEITPANLRTMLNVEDGATADQTASEILTLIKTVDGAGSGLDADTLDGVSSGSFIRSDATDTMSGQLTSTNNIRINDATKSFQVGDIDNDNFTGVQHVTGSSTIRGVSVNNVNASVIENLQGTTNQHIVLGDASNTSTEALLGVSITTASTEYVRMTLSGQGNLVVHNNITSTQGSFSGNGSGLTTLNASNLSSGTIPDARFPSTLPAVDGSALTGISAGATGGGSDELFYENGQTMTTDYTITNGKNAMCAGPITINSGVTLTIGDGENLVIV